MNNIDSHRTLGKVHKGGMSLVIAGFFFSFCLNLILLS